MTSASTNTDRNTSEQVSNLQPRSSRYENDYDPDAKSELESAPKRAGWEKRRSSGRTTETTLTPFGMVWPGIVLASACYPILAGSIVVLFAVLVNGVPWYEFGAGIFFLPIGFFVGMFTGIIMSVPAFLLTQMLQWSFNGIVSTRGATMLFGGMTVFLTVFLGALMNNQGLPADPEWPQICLLGVLVVGATAMGYLGAFVAGFLGRYDGFPFFEPVVYFDQQITIRFLLKLTLLVAMLAVIFKAAGWVLGGIWLAYLFSQLCLMFGDYWLTRWLLKRSRFKKQRALTSREH